jgi:vitamin K-dependent gamma-carboxylase-like protein
MSESTAVRAYDRWNDFWFAPRSTLTLGLARIYFSLLVIVWCVGLAPNLGTFFGPDGVAPQPNTGAYQWSVLKVWHGDAAAVTVWAVLLAAACLLAVGWHSRIMAVIVYIGLISLLHRNDQIFNSGDRLLAIEALFLLIGPCGAALSLDRRRTAGSFWDAQERAGWVIRLMQLQLCLIYLATVRDKLAGTTWPGGTAVSYSLRVGELSNVRMPDWLTTNALLMNAATWGTLLVELSLGTLIWVKALRPWILGAGVLLHLSIVFALSIGLFSWIMFVLYLAFVPDESAQRLINRVRRPRPEEPEEQREEQHEEQTQPEPERTG